MWKIADKIITSRFLLGTAQYPSLQIMQQAILTAKSEIITVSLKRQGSQDHKNNTFYDIINKISCLILPNTAGCHTANEAITVAEMARDIFQTTWIKLEVIGDAYNLHPDPFELVKAAKILIKNGFQVFPYCTDDLVLCKKLVDVGCEILMPLAAPIGSGKGLINKFSLEILRARLPNTTLIIDAGIGRPSHAVQAMELGFDAILLNSAVALSTMPIKMAAAFRDAIVAGRTAFEAGLIPERNIAHPTTSLIDTPFWHQAKLYE